MPRRLASALLLSPPPLLLLPLLLLLLAAAQAAAANDPKSFAVHVLHAANDPQSVLARDVLQQRFCHKFGVAPCRPGGAGGDSPAAAGVRITDNLVVEVSEDQLLPVLTWFQQNRDHRLNAPAEVDLDIAVHPNTAAGRRADYASFSLWGGHAWPVDLNALYASDARRDRRRLQDKDAWAYTCSSDAAALCGDGPFAENSTCRATPLGSHLHLFFRQNDRHAVRAVAEFKALASAALALPPGICADDYGHEQPHNASCWLTGPGGHEAGFPQDGNRSSFTSGTTSLYIHNRDFAPILRFLMTSVRAETLGADLDFLVHPNFGCSFVDHQTWSVHRGTSTPNNLFGIAQEGGWTDAETPSDLDPLARQSSSPDDDTKNNKNNKDAPREIAGWDVHVLYDPTSPHAVAAKDEWLRHAAADPTVGPALRMLKDEPFGFRDPHSPFLAGNAHLRCDDAVKLLQWISANAGVRRGGVDVAIVPDTGAASRRNDYAMRVLWHGNAWPVAAQNLPATRRRHGKLRAVAAAGNRLSAVFRQRRATATSAAHADVAVDWLLFVQRAPNNPYQTAASAVLRASLVQRFGATPCAVGTYPPSDLLPADGVAAVCVGADQPRPYETGDSTDPMTTSYFVVRIPEQAFAEFLAWIATRQSNVGYDIDLLWVPVRRHRGGSGDGASAPDVLAAYNAAAFHAGSTRWPVNKDALMDLQRQHAATEASPAPSSDMPSSVRYYQMTTVDQHSVATADVDLWRWHGLGYLDETDGVRAASSDWALTPPSIARLILRHNATTYPAWGGTYWLPADVYYTVISGAARFGDEGADSGVYAYGDLRWVAGGTVHGPIKSVGSEPLVVVVTSTSPFLLRLPEVVGTPSDANPSVQIANWTVTQRGYRQADSGETWRKNPSPHSDSCLDAGGVYNMGFDAEANSPAVLRVKWAPNCSIPFHYHPTGALYFVQYGSMYFRGDSSGGTSGDSLNRDVALTAADVRWVRPGFAYGPEYNSASAPMQITVLGTETPPQFAPPPAGPYKYQRSVQVSHVFDEL